MAGGEISSKESTMVIIPANTQVDKHDFDLSFFQNYVHQTLLNVDAHIGGYPASKFGSWEPTEVDGCNTCGRVTQRSGASKQVKPNGSCLHPFTLYPAAKEIAYLLKCRGLPDTDFWKVAEVEWKKEIKAIQKKVDEKETKVTKAISEMHQLVGLGATFQALLISTVVQMSSYTDLQQCKKGQLWFFISWSIFATIVTTTAVIHKVRLSRGFQKALDNNKTLLYEPKRLLIKLTVTNGPGFNLMPQIDYKPKLGKFKTFMKKRIYPVLEHSAFILVCAVIFGFIFAFAIAFICHAVGQG